MEHSQGRRGTGLALAGLAIIATLMGFGAAVEDPAAPFGPALLVLAGFLYLCALIYVAVHAVGGMMRDHELWKRRLDQSPADGRQ